MIDAPHTTYIDDSGTNNEARIICGAYCAASVANWKKFERQWNEIAFSAGFKHFHMTEFVSCRRGRLCRDCTKGKTSVVDHPWQTWSQSKRDSVIKSLAETINRFGESGIGMSIAKQDYDDLVLNSELKELASDVLGKLHFTYTIQLCGGHLEKWRSKNGLTKPMKYVFDTTESPEQRNEIASLFIASAIRLDAQHRFGFTPDGYSFESRKTLVQLLSADMLAWLSAKVRASEVFDFPLGREAKIAAKVFIDGGKLDIGNISREQLQEWAEKETADRKQRKAAANG